MGKRMFEAGEQSWPEDAPFHTPVFVVTHEPRDPWERPGGTTFHFVNDGIEAALDRAREAARDRDVRIAGGGATILEYVNAGLIDEFSIALSPVLFGSGIRLFEGVDAGRVALEPVRAEPSPRVTHLTYTVRARGSCLDLSARLCGAGLGVVSVSVLVLLAVVVPAEELQVAKPRVVAPLTGSPSIPTEAVRARMVPGRPESAAPGL